jgi:hypothetical protein
VSVYLGNGDGTFQVPIDSNTTSYSEFVVVGDFNGDGKMDIAIIDNPYISVLLGNGNGTFQAPSDNDSFMGPQWLAVGDFNNDHKLDIAVVGFYDGSQNIGVLLGNGKGTLNNSITDPLTYTPWSVATGDFDKDGNLDAVVSNEAGDVTVFLGNGNGTFQAGVTYLTTGFSGPVVVSDLNLDGKLDLVLGNDSGRVFGADVFWGNGDGTFQRAQFFSSGQSGLPLVGDLNGDHLPDLVLANLTYGAVTMLNTGEVSLSPTTPLRFPVQLVNTKSAPVVVTLTNSGAVDLSISSVNAVGEFQADNGCGNGVPAGGSCEISAVFRPRSAGAQTGLISIVDSASSKPQVIELAGTGTVVKLSPPKLTFAAQKSGTTSPAQHVQLTNAGSAPLDFTSAIYIGGPDERDFFESNNCPKSLAAGTSCFVSVVFAPRERGVLTASVVISSNGGGSPQNVPLSGTGD